jgi:hypothetical protein
MIEDIVPDSCHQFAQTHFNGLGRADAHAGNRAPAGLPSSRSEIIGLPPQSPSIYQNQVTYHGVTGN